ncbi:MAG: phosphoenolpyruvate synthase, partial [Simkaniaceae bacterium]|nr:phosphoenolpyruvate synthase [Simkaniaceae bacterium]
NLIGGDVFEPKEENPMLGFPGASRYYSPKYRDGFELECAAIKRVREFIGLDNVLIMVPFCHTLEEAKLVLDVLKENRLSRDHLQIYVMAEIISNIILAERFADLFIENDQAVKQQIQDLIEVAHKKGRKAGICGQWPSDDLEFAAFLVQCGIDSLSLTPDSFIQNVHQVSNIERDKK